MMENAIEKDYANEMQIVEDDGNQQTEKQQILKTMNMSSSTLKRSPKSELSKTDLLRLLSQYEGELQARDVVIATLKSEQVKQYLSQKNHQSNASGNDPLAALQRDNFATRSTDKMDVCLRVNQQLNSLENLVTQQRRSQCRVVRILREAEYRHRKEIELEKQVRRRFEREYLKLNEYLDLERNRHKHIVLFLLAERKKILMKYVEERKRSEDLAQILAEEKCRVDAMAEGLEEESKKSLQLEAEFEKQVTQFYLQSQRFKADLAKEQSRSEELENELEKSRNQIALLEKQLESCSKNAVICSSAQPADPCTVSMINVSCSVPSMMTSVAKVVQPTATASSVPVSSPMTGVAKSVSSDQCHNVRYVMYTPAVSAPVAQYNVISTAKQTIYNSTNSPSVPSAVPFQQNVAAQRQQQLQNEKKIPTPRLPSQTNVNAASSSTAAGTNSSISASPKVAVSSPNPAGAANVVTDSSPNTAAVGLTSTVRRLPLAVGKCVGRGMPPPVPPNKPIVLPKRDNILARKIETVTADLTAEIQADGKITTQQQLQLQQRCNILVASPRDKILSPGKIATATPTNQVKNDEINENNSAFQKT